jgi:hypothetical protein
LVEAFKDSVKDRQCLSLHQYNVKYKVLAVMQKYVGMKVQKRENLSVVRSFARCCLAKRFLVALKKAVRI